jgi:DNA polymerase
MKLHLDFETRSPVNLKTSGVSKYAEHPQTSILCLGYAFGDDDVIVAAPGDHRWSLDAVMEYVRQGKPVVAHNAPFELAIWNKVGVRDHGWPVLHPEQMDCTMARAYAMALPASLDNAAAAVGIETRKDMKGHRLMLKMSQPREVVPKRCKRCAGDGFDPYGKECLRCLGTGEGYVWWEDPEDFERLFAYCGQDINVERELDKRLLALSPNEKALWLVDYRINKRGISVDVDNARKAMVLVEQEAKRLDEAMRDVTGNAVASCKAHVQLRTWLGTKSVATEGVAKDDVIELLTREDLPVVVRRALEIRQEAAKSSTAKLKAMLAGADSERRLRGMFQFCGAGRTGRFAGRRVQLQNMPRPIGMKQSQIEEVFHWLDSPLTVDECRERIEMFYGPPMTVISSCLRGFLCAAPGKDLLAVDFSAIEARVIAWLAGERSVLDIFRAHGKIYEKAAAEVFGVKMESITKDDWRRMIGKVSVLALGFGGGVGAFQTMAKGLNVKMEPAFDALWARAEGELRDRALERCKKEHKKAGISEKEWLASELTKLFWRESHPNIVGYWTNLEMAAAMAIHCPGRTAVVTPLTLPPVKFLVKGSFLFCRLPSGRALCYAYPKIEKVKMPWGQEKDAITYMEEDSTTGKWHRQKTYGGKLAENITQAVARDLLTTAMLAAEVSQLPIVLHAHDEIVAEIPADTREDILREFETLVSTTPAWAQGLPVAAEGWRGKRYRK